MSIERELFQKEYCKVQMITDKRDTFEQYPNGDYVRHSLQLAWLMWQASANRQGCKLVPVEMSWQKADELASKEWDKNKSMFCADSRDMSALQVEEFSLRWCKNKAYQIMSDYKAMIGAIE